MHKFISDFPTLGTQSSEKKFLKLNYKFKKKGESERGGLPAGLLVVASLVAGGGAEQCSTELQRQIWDSQPACQPRDTIVDLRGLLVERPEEVVQVCCIHLGKILICIFICWCR